MKKDYVVKWIALILAAITFAIGMALFDSGQEMIALSCFVMGSVIVILQGLYVMNRNIIRIIKTFQEILDLLSSIEKPGR